jgi:hypothetical protein
MVATLLPSRMIGVIPKTPSDKRLCSTPAICQPLPFASTTVMRRLDVSSPKIFGSCTQ